MSLDRPSPGRAGVPGERSAPALVASGAAVASAGLAWVALTDRGGAFAGLADAVGRVALWGAVLVAAARWAAWAVGSRLTGIAHLAWDGAAGIALWIGVALAVGLLPGGFRRLVLASLLVLLGSGAALLARRDPLSRFRGAGPADRATAWLGLIAALLVTAGLAWDRVPPVFFDARAYHFAQPELWLVNGRIAPEPWSLHSWFPPGMSVLYGAGLASGGEAWANDANLLVGLLLVACAVDLARRIGGPVAAALVAGCLPAVPLVLHALAIPAADLGHGLFAFAAIGCLCVHAEDGWRCWLPRGGLCAAGAVLTKYLGLLVPLAAGALWLALPAVGRAREPGARAAAGRIARFAAPAALLLLPWLAANGTRVGNPVAPVASGVLPVRGLAASGAEAFRADARGGLPGLEDVARLGPRLLFGGEDASRLYPTPAWGAFPALLLPVALWAAVAVPRARAPALWAVGLLALWFATYRWERFLVASTALLVVAGCAGLAALGRRGGALRAVPPAALLLAAVSAVPAMVEVARFTGGLAVASGSLSPEAFVERALPSARLFRRAGELLDARTDRVLLLGEMRHYGLALDRAAPTGFNVHPLVTALESSPEPSRIRAALRAEGFTHLIVDPGWVARGAARYPSLAPLAGAPADLRGFLDALGPPLAAEDGVALYRIPE